MESPWREQNEHTYLTDFCDECGEENEIDNLIIIENGHRWVCVQCDDDYWKSEYFDSLDPDSVNTIKCRIMQRDLRDPDEQNDEQLIWTALHIGG